MRRFSAIVAIALVSLLFVSICPAQQTAPTSVPNLIRYSGTLKDTQGAALSSSTAVGVTFSIYKQQDGGAAVWMETQNVTPDGNGQYNVILGSTTATGLPDDLFSQQEQRWLGVQVQGEAEQARVLLVSVPYAFKAHEAETLGGLPASAFVQAAPSNASGTGSTDTGTAVNALSTAGNANISSKGKSTPASRKNVICAALTANGLANYVPLFDLTVCNLVDSAIYQLAGKIGIGTPAPSTALDVNGQINARQWYDIGPLELAFASNGFFIPAKLIPDAENTFVGLGAGTTNPGTPSPTLTLRNTFVGSNAGSNTTVSPMGFPNGNDNTFVGANAGFNDTTGGGNVFVGSEAGRHNISGSGNIYIGLSAGLLSTGSNNTMTGYLAGEQNRVDGNSFYGSQAGYRNTTGSQNTFFGLQAGRDNTLGSANTFVGSDAGQGSSSGPGGANSYNTFVGANAGYDSSNASSNTFLGYSAGSNTNTGFANTATGYDAGRSNTIGEYNVFYGVNAGYNVNGPTIGSLNTFLGTGAGSTYHATNVNNSIYIGFNAGEQEGNVSNNIEIGNTGPSPLGSTPNTILIGTNGTQNATYVAGVFTSTVAMLPTDRVVCVNPAGGIYGAPLGADCTLSSRRFKENIHDMGDSSSKLFQLRPVTFFYKPQYDDGSHLLQYGLIAEEVAKVYPDLVAYDKDGQPLTVKYQLLAPMLLGELQKEHTVVMAQQDELQTQLQQIKAQRQEIEGLKHQLQQQNASLQERLTKLESYVATQMKTASDNPPPMTATANGGVQ